MTDYQEIDNKCNICGKTSKQRILLSTNNLGYPDLDTRPAEMQRSTMDMWVQECPHCGYVAQGISQESNIKTDYLQSQQYKTCDGINFKSELSQKFYKNYLLETKKGDDKKAYSAILYCAWACDDNEDIQNAKQARQIAIKLADKIIKTTKQEKTNIQEKNKTLRRKHGTKYINNLIVMKSDLLRRINNFDQLIEEYENFTIEDQLLDKIIKFQLKKAYEKDNKCYTLKEVLKK